MGSSLPMTKHASAPPPPPSSFWEAAQPTQWCFLHPADKAMVRKFKQKFGTITLTMFTAKTNHKLKKKTFIMHNITNDFKTYKFRVTFRCKFFLNENNNYALLISGTL